MQRLRALEGDLDRRRVPQHRLEERADLRDERPGRLEARERLQHGARLEQRVVGRVRVRGVTAPAPEAELERRRRLLPDAAEVVDPAPEDAALSPALVQREGRANGVRMGRCEPRHAVVDADLLVGRQREEHVPGRAHALPRERGKGHGRGRDVPLHVERAATPHLAVDEVARPRIACPLGRVRENGVRVRHEEQRRPVAPGEPGDEVCALRGLREELARDAVASEVFLQHGRRACLVPGGIDRIQTDEVPEELRDLIPERQADSAFDRAVSSFRTSHSSGKRTVCTRRPSTSTGVPCVPTTESPITRATTR